jgi:hypothetical protein
MLASTRQMLRVASANFPSLFDIEFDLLDFLSLCHISMLQKFLISCREIKKEASGVGGSPRWHSNPTT